MNLIQETHNPLLRRREVSVLLHARSNPGVAGTTQKLAEHFKVSETHIAVKSVRNSYGSHDILVKAFIYDSPEMKEKIEPKVKIKKAAA